MNIKLLKRIRWVLMLMTVILLFGTYQSQAALQGIAGSSFNLTAKTGYINTPDGNSIFMWGYALNNGVMQYPGPTMIVNQGAVVTVTLTNSLTMPVSIVFPGQSSVVAIGGAPGLITQEAPPGGTVTYTFTASQPGTYTYYSGTSPELQIEMGLVGALIVRPSTNTTTQAYNHPDSQFEHEYLFLLSEIDPTIHELAELGWMNLIDNTTHWPVYWFINGRAAPDTMADANVSWLPNQPYNCIPMMHPGERVLIRMIGGGRDLHPLHTHGNHHRVIARDGRLLTGVSGADLSETLFTSSVVPGGTTDAIFTWTGEYLGWDFYGHTPGSPLALNECPNGQFDPGCDHGKPFPVILPNQQDMTFGMFYGGSPLLGALGALPPGEGGFNPNGGFMYMWHSHAEKELTNNDIFPGGLLTMMIIEHPSVTLMNP